MELHKQQLQQLSAWLTLMEDHIQKMETCPLDDDLQSLQKLLEDHKVNLARFFLFYLIKYETAAPSLLTGFCP